VAIATPTVSTATMVSTTGAAAVCVQATGGGLGTWGGGVTVAHEQPPTTANTNARMHRS
jgi:hypothetical protein